MKRFIFKGLFFISLLCVNHSVLAEDHTWDGDNIRIRYFMEEAAYFGHFGEIITIYVDASEFGVIDISFHDASSYENDNQYTTSDNIDLNSNNPIVSAELSFYDLHSGGWFKITETGYYDMVLYKTNEDGKEKITVTAHAHQPKPVLKTDNVTPTGFYYCEHCNKYFSDETGINQANEEDIDYTVTAVSKITDRNITHSKKHIENKALIIEKNGVKYDVLGRKLK